MIDTEGPIEKNVGIEIPFEILNLYLYHVILEPLKCADNPIFKPMWISLMSGFGIPRLTKSNVFMLVAYVRPISIVVISRTLMILMLMLLILMDLLAVYASI